MKDLRSCRKAKGLTIADLSTLTGLREATISEMERGLRIPRSKSMQLIEGIIGKVGWVKRKRIVLTQDMIETILICSQYMKGELLSIHKTHRTPDWPANMKDTEDAIAFFKPLSELPY